VPDTAAVSPSQKLNNKNHNLSPAAVLMHRAHKSLDLCKFCLFLDADRALRKGTMLLERAALAGASGSPARS